MDSRPHFHREHDRRQNNTPPRFDWSGVKQEEIVNQGYRALLADALTPDVPPPAAAAAHEHELGAHDLLRGSTV